MYVFSLQIICGTTKNLKLSGKKSIEHGSRRLGGDFGKNMQVLVNFFNPANVSSFNYALILK